MERCCAAASVCMCSATWDNNWEEKKIEAGRPRYHVPRRANSFKVTSVWDKMAPCAEEKFHVVLSLCPADLQPYPGGRQYFWASPRAQPCAPAVLGKNLSVCWALAGGRTACACLQPRQWCQGPCPGWVGEGHGGCSFPFVMSSLGLCLLLRSVVNKSWLVILIFFSENLSCIPMVINIPGFHVVPRVPAPFT